MKVVFAHKFYRPVGGTEEFLRQFEHLMGARGHEVIPFAMRHADNWPTPWERYFVPEIDYRSEPGGIDRVRRAMGAVPRLLYWPEARRRFARLLDDTRPDVIHIQNIAHQISPSILYAASERHIPVVMTVNDYKLVCPTSAMINGRTGAICDKCFVGRYWNVVADRCHDDSLAGSGLLALEMTVHHKLLRVWDRHVRLFFVESPTRFRTLVAGGVPQDRIRLLTQPFDATPYAAQPLGEDQVGRALYFGRLDADKGVDGLIEAVATAGTELDIVGRGTEEAALAALAARRAPGRIRFHGPRYGQELVDVVRRAGVTVLNSRQMEGTPYAVLQSYAWGRSVIATDVGSLPDVVEDGRTGLVVPAGDAAALVTALRRLADVPDLARTLGANARAHVLERYSPDAFYEALLPAYAEAGVAAARA